MALVLVLQFLLVPQEQALVAGVEYLAAGDPAVSHVQAADPGDHKCSGEHGGNGRCSACLCIVVGLPQAAPLLQPLFLPSAGRPAQDQMPSSISLPPLLRPPIA